jgi:16S rRNA (guanine966-N2)-methyltransferase
MLPILFRACDTGRFATLSQMSRIVSGFAGSLRLRVPTSGTRPTSDRVREAVFSALDARGVIPGARVLDLYAGSGALGLEAASRGAASVVLVERSPQAARVCRENAAALRRAAGRTPPQIEVHASSVHSYLDGSDARFNIVFIDPPYDLGESALAGTLAAVAGLLEEDATVLVERSSRSPEPDWPDALVPVRSKTYGETVVWTAAPSGQPAAPSQPE